MTTVAAIPQASKDEQVNAVIVKSSTVTAVAGFADPTPGGVDVPVIIGAWVVMLGRIAKIYDVPFDANAVKNVLVQAVGGVSLFMAGTKVLTWLLKMTGVGWLGGGLINAVLNGWFTLQIGRMYKTCWRRGSVSPSADEVMTTLRTVLSVGAMIGLAGEVAGQVGDSWRVPSTSDGSPLKRSAFFESLFGRMVDRA